MTDLTMGSLFAGVGGFDIAAERNGIKVVWQSENDKHASAVLAEHFPNIPNYGDIHDIKAAPKVDILAGGFPCPSYSVAGNRGGLADDRGALWWEFRRLIGEGKPTWVMGENVPGLLSSSGGRDFATIVRSLVQLGYGVVWRVLDAQYFGVAQRRRRLFIVGHLGGRPRPEVLALAEGLSGYPEPSREAREEAAGEPSRGSGIGGGRGVVASPSGFGQEPTPVGWAEPHRSRNPEITGDISITLPARMGTGGNNGPMVFTPPDSKGPLVSEEKALTLSTNSDQTLFVNGRQNPIVSDNLAQPLDTNGNTPVVAYDELNDSTADVHHTRRAGTKQSTGVIQNMAVRRLTPLECERLQDFPDGWTESQSDTQRYRQMGNAVAVPVVEWIMRRIVMAENGKI